MFDREGESFNALLSLINMYLIKAGVRDSWKWTSSSSGHYSTKEAYLSLLNTRGRDPINANRERSFKLIWNRFSPLKVATHAWRLIRDRLPTKTNFIRRNILTQNSDMKCVLCGNHEESGKHIFFQMLNDSQGMDEMLNWLGIPTVPYSNPMINLITHSCLLKGEKGKDIAVSIWNGVVWSI